MHIVDSIKYCLVVLPIRNGKIRIKVFQTLRVNHAGNNVPSNRCIQDPVKYFTITEANVLAQSKRKLLHNLRYFAFKKITTVNLFSVITTDLSFKL